MSHQATVRVRIGDQSASRGPDTAAAYNDAGDDYLLYADGDPGALYAFDGRYAFGDRYIWQVFDAKLHELAARGRKSIRVLDAGCGPGTWLRRIVVRARELGFEQIVARGFDLAENQVDRARDLSGELAASPGVAMAFEVGDLTRPLAEADASVDLTLCLYGVLNHLPRAALPAVLAEVARVTRGSFVSSVRSVGSTPSIFIDSVERARSFRQDNQADRCDVELANGRRVTLPCHLFSAQELRGLAQVGFSVEDLRGLDLFHGRFCPDPRWNPPSAPGARLDGELRRLEEAYARQPGFIDCAAHLLLIAQPMPGKP